MMNAFLKFRVLAVAVLNKDDRKYSLALRVVTWRQNLSTPHPRLRGASPP